MTVSDLFPSKYLAKEDVPQPTVATIQSVTQVEMNDNGAKRMKPILMLSTFGKPMVLNKLNASSIAAIYGGDTSAWIGKPIEVFVDPNVMMQGRMVGGLRLRAPTRQTVPVVNLTTGEQLWDYSDGQNLTKQQTTAQVVAFLDDLLPGAVERIRVRASGGASAPVPAPQWLAEHGQSAPVPTPVDEVPW